MTEWLSAEDVAGRLGLRVATVRAYVRSGRLPATRVGKQYRIADTAVDALLSGTAGATSGASPAGPLTADLTGLVQVGDLDQPMAQRLIMLWGSAAREYRAQLTVHHADRGLRAVVTGPLGEALGLLGAVQATIGVIDDNR